MRIGLVGKPNVGKSTLFSAATLAQVDIANYPFCTIDPNIGVAFVEARLPCPCKDLRERLEAEGRIEPVSAEDPRQGSLCSPRTGSCVQHRRSVPVALVDVAGLVPGASEGRGRGNAFLADLANCDVLIQVVDAAASTDLEGQFTGATSSIDEAVESVHAELAFLETELDAWIGGLLEDGWNRGVRRVQAEGEKGLMAFVQERLSVWEPPTRWWPKGWRSSTNITALTSNRGTGIQRRFTVLAKACVVTSSPSCTLPTKLTLLHKGSLTGFPTTRWSPAWPIWNWPCEEQMRPVFLRTNRGPPRSSSNRQRR